MTLERITIEALPKFSGLNEASVENYAKAKLTFRPILANRILLPFYRLLTKQTGFSDKNLPKDTTEETYKFGDVTFTVESSRTVKRPKLAKVYEGMVDYLTFIKEGHAVGINRKGVRTFDDKPFILLEDVTEKLASLRASVTEESLTQKLSYDWNIKENNNLVVPLSTEITLSEPWALLYVGAEVIDAYLQKEVIKAFEDRLKENTGYSKTNVPDELTTNLFQVGQHLFEVQSKPEQTPKYATILDTVGKPLKGRYTKRSKVGDLERIREGLDLKTELCDARSDSGAKGNKYVSVGGILQRLQELKEEYTNPSLNQFVKPAFII
jgi:hypothetical protein